MLSYGHSDRNVTNDMSKMRSLAKAKYDNLAESLDELAFRKGDVLTVIDQKIEGLDGWWLCSFRGKQGIVPANRVTLLAGMYHESSLRFSTSPESSVSDGSGVDYDIPKTDPQNRQLPPLPIHNKTVLDETSSVAPVREILYDIPKSLEKTRVHATQPAKQSNQNEYKLNGKLGAKQEQSADNNVYDTLPPTQVVVTPGVAGLMGRRSSGPVSPIYKSGDSAVDMTSNRSSLMSNTSSPPGSSVCDFGTEANSDIYDTPSSSRLAVTNKRQAFSRAYQKVSDSKLAQKQQQSTEGYYDVPKTVQEALLDYRDSGIYDNARLSVIQTSPQKELNVYDSPDSGSKPVSGERRLNVPKVETTVYDIPTQLVRRDAPVHKRTDSSNSLGSQSSRRGSIIDIDEMEKLVLELDAAIDIIGKLRQHVHTSTTRLLSFVHSKWRVRSNLESILYDLKLACVGLQSTLQEFYDFGTGALANSTSICDKTIKNRLMQVLVPLKRKLDMVNDSMKSLSGIKWHVAKLEEGSVQETGGDDLLKLMAVAREVGEDVNRVSSVIHGNSSLLFKSPSTVQDITNGTRDSTTSVAPTTQRCLVRDETIDSYHEYDYCELTDREDTPTNESSNIISNRQTNLDRDQDAQYLRYYTQHVHTICDTVKLHISRMRDTVGVSNNNQSTQTVVSHSKQLVSAAHKLVYIGDTLCRSVRQPFIHTAISDDANALCNALKDFIMSTKDVALSQSAARPVAMARLNPHIEAIELRTESFRKVISKHST